MDVPKDQFVSIPYLETLQKLRPGITAEEVAEINISAAESLARVSLQLWKTTRESPLALRIDPDEFRDILPDLPKDKVVRTVIETLWDTDILDSTSEFPCLHLCTIEYDRFGGRKSGTELRRIIRTIVSRLGFLEPHDDGQYPLCDWLSCWVILPGHTETIRANYPRTQEVADRFGTLEEDYSSADDNV